MTGMTAGGSDEDLWFDRLCGRQQESALPPGGLSDDDLEDARVLRVALREQLSVLQNEFVADEARTQAYLFRLRREGLMEVRKPPPASRFRRWRYAVAAVLVVFALIPVAYFSLTPERGGIDRNYYGSRLVAQSIRVADPQGYSADLLDVLKTVALQVERSRQVSQQVSYWKLEGRFVNPPDSPTREVIARYGLDRKKMRTVGAAAEFQLRIMAR